MKSVNLCNVSVRCVKVSSLKGVKVTDSEGSSGGEKRDAGGV